MRFYDTCIAMAQQVLAEMSVEEQRCFAETPYADIWQYHFSVGLWIRNHYLNESDYLYRALRVLGRPSADEMSLFLLEFIQQYLQLERANML